MPRALDTLLTLAAIGLIGWAMLSLAVPLVLGLAVWLDGTPSAGLTAGGCAVLIISGFLLICRLVGHLLTRWSR